MTLVRSIFLLLYLGVFFCLPNAMFGQEEYIKDYKMSIKINEDRSIDFNEQIQIQANGNAVRHGIVKCFNKTTDIAPHGKHASSFKVHNVLHDNSPEQFSHIEKKYQRQFYIGKKGTVLDPGIHNYKIEYTINNNVGFHDEYEELTIDILGNFSQFDFKNATITLECPDVSKLDNYFTIIKNTTDSLGLFATRRFAKSLEYTNYKTIPSHTKAYLVLRFKPGTFKPPTFIDKYGLSLMFLVLILLTILGYIFYYYTYINKNQLGKNKDSCRFSPKLSPASYAYFLNRKPNTDNIIGSILDLVFHRFVDIRFNPANKFVLVQEKKSSSKLPIEQQDLMHSLFDKKDQLVLTKANGDTLARAFLHYLNKLDKKYKNTIENRFSFTRLILPLIWLSVCFYTLYYLNKVMLYELYISEIAVYLLIASIAIFMLFFYALVERTSQKKMLLQLESVQLKQQINELANQETTRNINDVRNSIPYSYAMGMRKECKDLALYLDKNSDDLRDTRLAKLIYKGIFYSQLHHLLIDGLEKIKTEKGTKEQSSFSIDI